MKIRLHQADIADTLIEHTYPEGFRTTNSAYKEQQYQGSFFFGNGTYREFFFDGLHIGYGQLVPNSHTQIAIESDFETVEMHFALQGDACTWSDDGRVFEFGQNQHNILYASNFKGLSEWAPSSMRVFEVNLLPSVFRKYLPKEGPIFRQFNQMIDQKRTGFLSPVHYPITPAMLFIIREIIHCKREGVFKRAFLEAKVLELLLLQLEQMNQTGTTLCTDLKKADVDKMYAIKELLEQNTDAQFRLTDLARNVGTNEFTLKKGFKALFGTTVFDYWHQLKMEKARKLLVEDGWNVQQVSEEIGYMHAHHFSTAFKKRYGVSPSTLKMR